MNKLEIKYVKLNDIKPYNKNPRLNEEAIPYVMKSIQEFGFRNPVILDKNNIIVCGHTRVESAKRLEIKEIPCLYVDDLNEEQIKAFRLADNKVSEKANWNFELLDEELNDILNINMEDFGFLENNEDVLDDFIEDKPEIEFSEVIGEEHNYIVLYFDNEVDWLQAESLFDIKPVKCGSTRIDKKINKNMERIGVGRVLKGSEALNKILEAKHENIG